MAQKQWIARAGRGLLDVLKLLLRGADALCAAIGSFVLFAWKNAEESSPQAGELSDAERKMRDLDPGFEDGGFYRYRRH